MRVFRGQHLPFSPSSEPTHDQVPHRVWWAACLIAVRLLASAIYYWLDVGLEVAPNIECSDSHGPIDLVA